MLVIKTDSRLHTPMYFFVFNIAYLDICYTTTLVPQTVRNLLSSKSFIFVANCAIQMFFSILFGAVQIILIAIMAYDRYVAISNPLRYKMVMNWNICGIFLASAYAFSVALGIILIYSIFSLPFCGNKIEHFCCDMGQVLYLACLDAPMHYTAEAASFLIGIAFFTIPFILMLISYMYIINAVLKIRTNEGRRKAFSTCSSHLTLVIVEYGCLGFIYYRPKEAYALDKNKAFVMAFTFMTPILNPVIYTLRNDAIKKGFIKLTSKKSL
ncbi:olfactory receptor 10Q1-like [Hyperolius riggenbachi]|uniref:olfactory receptor 10Q1-like n=1 Tax=Hyperolius riggenbachi TaxID=752182 RepID=UPI0035A3281B